MLDNLRVFLQVVECGSFSEAGRALGIAPSSVSRAIDRLETSVQAQLLNRSTRSISLTENGRSFREQCESIVSRFDEAKASLQQNEQLPSGELRVTCYTSFGRGFVAPRMPKFLKQYPALRLSLDLEDRLVDLVHENVDVGIRIGSATDSSLRMRRLFEANTLLVAAPSYLKEIGEPESPEDLRQHNCLCLDKRRQVVYWHFVKGSSKVRVAVNGSLRSGGGDAIHLAAREGLGVTLVCEFMCREDLQSGRLVRLLPEWRANKGESSSSYTYLVYAPTSPKKLAIRAFIDFLVAEVAEAKLGLGHHV